MNLNPPHPPVPVAIRHHRLPVLRGVRPDDLSDCWNRDVVLQDLKMTKYINMMNRERRRHYEQEDNESFYTTAHQLESELCQEAMQYSAVACASTVPGAIAITSINSIVITVRHDHALI